MGTQHTTHKSGRDFNKTVPSLVFGISRPKKQWLSNERTFILFSFYVTLNQIHNAEAAAHGRKFDLLPKVFGRGKACGR